MSKLTCQREMMLPAGGVAGSLPATCCGVLGGGLSHCALVWEVIHRSACAPYGGNFRDFRCLPGLSDFSACCPHSFGEYFEFLCEPELHKNISDVLCYLLPSNMHFTPPPPCPPTSMTIVSILSTRPGYLF